LTARQAYGYVRVSGKGQGDGDGLLRQEEAVIEYAEAQGIEIAKIYPG
jgi:DNA invertase Pin-like site-specific DNA recombinase